MWLLSVLPRFDRSDDHVERWPAVAGRRMETPPVMLRGSGLDRGHSAIKLVTPDENSSICTWPTKAKRIGKLPTDVSFISFVSYITDIEVLPLVTPAEKQTGGKHHGKRASSHRHRA